MRNIKTTRLFMRNFTAEDWIALKEMILQYMSSPYSKYGRQRPTTDNDVKGG